MKKIFLLLTLILIGISISSCNKKEVTDNKNEYIITVITNNGDASYSITSDETLEKLTSPVFNGYIFAGWYLDKEYNEKVDFNKEINSDLTLYAKWLSISTGEVYDPDFVEEKKYTVTYKHEDETVISTTIIKENETLTKPSNPIKQGYTFKGWYLKNSDVNYSFGNLLTSDLVLYARFEKLTLDDEVEIFKVTYKYDDETIINTINISSTETLTKPLNPVKEGYTFKGWYLKDSNTEYKFGNKITSNITLYAKFEIVLGEITLSFTDSYYDELNGKLDNSFKYKLHELIESTHTNRVSYSEVWDVLLEADADPNKSGSVLCFYTGVSYSKRDNGSLSSGVWNREHVWPKSLGFSDQSYAAHNDCHHLHATEKQINANRGNSFFGEVTSGSSDSYGNKWTSSLFEPRDSVKGDVARSIFYMVVRYEDDECSCDLDLELICKNSPSSSSAKEMGNLETLLKWHYQDPVDDIERNRNEVVYSYQGNRNPFIDHEEFVSYLYPDKVSKYTDTSKLQYLI